MSIENLLDKSQLESNETASPEEVSPYYNPSMGDLLSETDQLYLKVADNDNLMSKISAVTSDLEGITTTVNMENGLSDYSRQVLARTFKTLTGVDVLGGRLLALESADGADDAFKDGVVAETATTTLNEFLVALKRTFYDSWGDTKSWYSKVTSIRETIRLKNADIIQRATKVTGEPKVLEFTFKENIDVDNNGKVSHQEILQGLRTLLTFTENRLNVKTDKEFEDFIVGCQRLVDGYKTSSEVDETELLKYKNLYTPSPEVLTSPIEDSAQRAKFTDSPSAKLVQTRNFPGAAYAVISTPGAKSGATPYSFIEDSWMKFYSESSAKESVTVRTFYPNQIVSISEVIADLLDSLTYFDKSWERRDRFMTRVFGSLDKTIQVIGSKLTDSSEDKKVDEQLRGLTRIMIRAIQLDNTFNAMLINHVIKVTSQLNDLDSACLLQYNNS